MLVSTGFLCDVFGCDRKALTRFTRRGMPKRGRGQWHLAECVQWMLEDVARDLPVGDQEAGARRELVIAQTARVNLEIARMTGELYAAEDVHQVLEQIAAIVLAGLNALPPRLAVHAGKSPAELEDAADDECAGVARELRAALGALRESEDDGEPA